MPSARVVGLGAEVVLVASLWAGFGLGTTSLVVGAIHAIAVWFILGVGWPGALSPADRVTLIRVVLGGGVTALAFNGPGFMLVALAAVALVLDAVDGQVARRTGTASRKGARFDMEADAFLILVLSVHVAFTLGPWVLAIGLMRYAFVAISWAAGPWMRSDLPPSLARKTVAAFQGIALVTASAGVFPAALAGAALALLVWSFGRDIAWLWFNRPVLEDGNGTRVLDPISWNRGSEIRRPARTGTR